MGYDETLVLRALEQAGGDENLAVNLLLDNAVESAASPSTAASCSRTASPATASRFFVVRHSEVESSYKADVYVHGLSPDSQSHATSGNVNGSDMWLGKLELGENVFGCNVNCWFACLSYAHLSGVSAIVHRIDRTVGKAFARMQGDYDGINCFFEGKDMIDFDFDEIYLGREVGLYWSRHVRVTYFCHRCMSFRQRTLKFNSMAVVVLQFFVSPHSPNVGIHEHFRNHLYLQVASRCHIGFEDPFFWPMTSSAIV